MTFEIPGTPKRPGWICWQIRYERQPDGSLKRRHEYMTAPRKEAAPAPPRDQHDGDGMNYLDSPGSGHHGEPTTRRGIAVETQRNLL